MKLSEIKVPEIQVVNLVSCPSCNASIGEKCQTLSHSTERCAHEVRVRAAQRILKAGYDAARIAEQRARLQ
ncbi:MAG TPA: hypothetical protein VN622_08980 [Clostridia bacterium]|nr:hypothetical protein [Clostridia bacterium]